MADQLPVLRQPRGHSLTLVGRRLVFRDTAGRLMRRCDEKEGVALFAAARLLASLEIVDAARTTPDGVFSLVYTKGVREGDGSFSISLGAETFDFSEQALAIFLIQLLRQFGSDEFSRLNSAYAGFDADGRLTENS